MHEEARVVGKIEGRFNGRITGWGAYVPERVVTNFDLEKSLDTSDEWIVQRSGIRDFRSSCRPAYSH